MKNTNPNIKVDLNSLDLSDSTRQAISQEFKSYSSNKGKFYVALILGIVFIGISIIGSIFIEQPDVKEEGGFILLFVFGVGAISEARSNLHRIRMRSVVVELINKANQSSEHASQSPSELSER